MSTSATTGLSKPTGSDKVSLGTLGYVRARTKQRAYDVVIREFKKSGISQAVLAKRLDKAPEVVSRLLSRPRNLELETFSDLMFAISGAVATFDVQRPLEKQEFKKHVGVSAASVKMLWFGGAANDFQTTRQVAVA